jgi:hypothetical protein
MNSGRIKLHTRFGMPTFDVSAVQRRNTLLRTRLSPAVFSVIAANKKVEVQYRGKSYRVRAIMAIAAHLVDRIVTEADYSSPGKVLKIAYKRDQDRPEHYIGNFTLDFSKLNLEKHLSMVIDQGLRNQLRQAFSMILVRIKTTPFYVHNERIEVTDDIGLINLIGNAEDAETALATLREPRDKIFRLLADQLETKLSKAKFLQTQFTISSEVLIKKLLSIL